MRTPRTTLLASFAAILAVGMLSGALGPLVPELAGRLSVRVEALGSLFSALFLGAVVTQFAGGWLNERIGLRAMFMAGVALLTAGIAGIAVAPSLPVVLLCALVAGAGQGALDISTNVLVPAVYEGHRAVAAVNILHFSFGAGAVVTPVLIAFTVQRLGTPMPALWLAVLLAAATLLSARRLVLDPSVRREHGAEPGGQKTGLYRRPELWLLAALMFLYVGAEMGVGGWTTVYMQRSSTLGRDAIAYVASAYWLSLTGGRLLGAAVGARVGARALALWSVVGSCVGSALLLLGGVHPAWAVAGTVLLGLSFGPIFPTLVVIVTEIFPAAPSRAVSLVIASSSLGGMLLPPTQGLLLERVGPLASAAQIAVCCAAILVLLLLQRRSTEARRDISGAAAAVKIG